MKKLLFSLLAVATCHAGEVIGNEYFDDHGTKHIILRDSGGRYYLDGTNRIAIDNAPKTIAVWDGFGYVAHTATGGGVYVDGPQTMNIVAAIGAKIPAGKSVAIKSVNTKSQAPTLTIVKAPAISVANPFAASGADMRNSDNTASRQRAGYKGNFVSRK